MKVLETNLPPNSLLHTDGVKYDFVDSFAGEINESGKQLTSKEIGKAFFTSAPKWVGNLFELRNKIVGIMGLKTSGKIENRQQLLDNFNCEKGEQLGLFKVFEQTENEIILGEDDKHLNFRVSLFLEKTTTEKRQLVISTTVKFNNAFGRLYFLPVRPFHKIIVPKMLKGIIKKFESPAAG